jgi:hypothetical protein
MKRVRVSEIDFRMTTYRQRAYISKDRNKNVDQTESVAHQGPLFTAVSEAGLKIFQLSQPGTRIDGWH